MIIILIFACTLLYSIRKSDKNLTQLIQNKSDFNDRFLASLIENKYDTLHSWQNAPFFGLAINKSLDSVAIYIKDNLKIYSSNDILSCTKTDHYVETIQAKTKSSVIVPTSRTQGNVIKRFAYSELLISVSDPIVPVIKIIFPKKEEAETYNALITRVAEKRVKIPNDEDTHATSLSPNLIKLFEMHQKGLITDIEFQTEKDKYFKIDG